MKPWFMALACTKSKSKFSFNVNLCYKFDTFSFKRWYWTIDNDNDNSKSQMSLKLLRNNNSGRLLLAGRNLTFPCFFIFLLFILCICECILTKALTRASGAVLLIVQCKIEVSSFQVREKNTHSDRFPVEVPVEQL